MSDLKYSNNHTWVRVDGNIATVGFTQYASNNLNEIAGVELPEVGTLIGQNTIIGNIEAGKGVIDFYSPIAGELVEVNQAVVDDPELINQDAYGEGWLAKIKFSDSSAVNALLSEQQYSEFIKGLSEA
ncbi:MULTISPECIES: glycine cleavage system protein GcvH [unclassified Nostoc]|uniref:glycine cleavage system protein GcvH n=1 Tax=unclassified Nostoc TaxID=2593658 RepID=UPI002AD318D3|nr:glycine cleavage system protein GcvH [Nostoc sp. DedQUE03]MDZ7971193.1 glycine cleavage system protein GcvH [Nostoc sp. DedQUE03]MDZ8048681.1 glycine cleavage system protein GcvH [Nostoc sp. DedQUE02]